MQFKESLHGQAGSKALTCLLIALLFVAGCAATPRERVANAERAYRGAADVATLAVQHKLIKGEDVLNAVKFANDEANAALADANARVQKDEKFDTEFWLNRVNSAITRLADITTKAQAK